MLFCEDNAVIVGIWIEAQFDASNVFECAASQLHRFPNFISWELDTDGATSLLTDRGCATTGSTPTYTEGDHGLLDNINDWVPTTPNDLTPAETEADDEGGSEHQKGQTQLPALHSSREPSTKSITLPTQEALLDSAAAKPAAAEPAAIEPAAAEPVSVEPAAIEPTAAEPTASNRASRAIEISADLNENHILPEGTRRQRRAAHATALANVNELSGFHGAFPIGFEKEHQLAPTALHRNNLLEERKNWKQRLKSLCRKFWACCYKRI
ncbi:hypothetical protein K432DRAFT_422450 [Lepidopterella palustris CBS 459.81]|uniref:Uncharacterized protein n=1 Tax=Lepidopterella palustris CBS 459.81 TaxID=1314670 RepID=A0A8E2EIR3_9PEZI|nr:hypothetical protein K432DRAFT_422450 [Lepidopterella palustris CBS 459.81]